MNDKRNRKTAKVGFERNVILSRQF